MTNKNQVRSLYPKAVCKKIRNWGPGYITMYAVYLDKKDNNPEFGRSAAQSWEFTLNFRISPYLPVLHHQCADCGMALGLGEIHECLPEGKG